MGFTNPLEAAILSRNETAALQLIAGRQFVRSRNHERLTALHWAAQYGQFSVVKALVAAGADLEAVNINGNRPLHAAVGSRSADPNIVKLLLKSGAEVNARGVYGTTALHIAACIASRGQALRIAAILIEGGADVNVRAEQLWDQSPLEIGEQNHPGFVDELCSRGVLRGFY
ncbi:MAG: ankyrin repeat domain-containing protein [Alphaproteobacteria bacterium]|nr:ankyrin repeat domain-containing protein [Alphaproteobacteria bacterium]